MKAVYKTLGVKGIASDKAFKEESNYLDNLTYVDKYLFCLNLIRPQFQKMLKNPEVTVIETEVAELGDSIEFLKNIMTILSSGKKLILTDAHLDLSQDDFNLIRLLKDHKKYIRKRIISEQQELKQSLNITDNLIGRPKSINTKLSNLVLELYQEGLSYKGIQDKLQELGESRISKASICRILKDKR